MSEQPQPQPLAVGDGPLGADHLLGQSEGVQRGQQHHERPVEDGECAHARERQVCEGTAQARLEGRAPRGSSHDTAGDRRSTAPAIKGVGPRIKGI